AIGLGRRLSNAARFVTARPRDSRDDGMRVLLSANSYRPGFHVEHDSHVQESSRPQVGLCGRLRQRAETGTFTVSGSKTPETSTAIRTMSRPNRIDNDAMILVPALPAGERINTNET